MREMTKAIRPELLQRVSKTTNNERYYANRAPKDNSRFRFV